VRRFWVVLLALAATIGCDRLTKDLAQERLRGQGRRSFLGDTVRLEYVENRGAFLDLGAQLGVILAQFGVGIPQIPAAAVKDLDETNALF